MFEAGGHHLEALDQEFDRRPPWLIRAGAVTRDVVRWDLAGE